MKAANKPNLTLKHVEDIKNMLDIPVKNNLINVFLNAPKFYINGASVDYIENSFSSDFDSDPPTFLNRMPFNTMVIECDSVRDESYIDGYLSLFIDSRTTNKDEIILLNYFANNYISKATNKDYFYLVLTGITRKEEKTIIPTYTESVVLLNVNNNYITNFQPIYLDSVNDIRVDDMQKAMRNISSLWWFDLYAMFNILECGNTDIEIEKSSSRLNKKRIKKGKLPFFDYHVLTVNRHLKSVSNTQNINHRSPRQHIRRGHIRHYKDGRKIFIQSCIVGDSDNGLIKKDYRIVGINA